MGRHVNQANIKTRTARMKLAPGKKFCLHNIIQGKASIAYQRLQKGQPGRWVLRETTGPNRYRLTNLGLADDYGDADGKEVLTFEQACDAARAAYKGEKSAGAKSLVTVKDAVLAYLKYLKEQKATGRDTEYRANAFIIPQLGKFRLSELTTAQIYDWRDKLAATGARARASIGAKPKFKPMPSDAEGKRKRKSSVNKSLTILKAALNRAFRDGHINDDSVWRKVKPFERVSAARPDFFSLDESQQLIAGASNEFRPILHGALLTGARWSELCALQVKHFAFGKIHIAFSKTGKSRDIVLTDEGINFFTAQTAGRAPNDYIFIRADGLPWASNQQPWHMAQACDKAGLTRVGFHQLRHTYASLSVMNGMPLAVLARQLGHSSLAMLERHYGHLATSYLDAQVAATAPRFSPDPR
jgi:integrase